MCSAHKFGAAIIFGTTNLYEVQALRARVVVFALNCGNAVVQWAGVASLLGASLSLVPLCSCGELGEYVQVRR